MRACNLGLNRLLSTYANEPFARPYGLRVFPTPWLSADPNWGCAPAGDRRPRRPFPNSLPPNYFDRDYSVACLAPASLR